jgi:hypothetical protein
VLGVPFVNLVYRHLAVDDEQLAAVWGTLAPNLGSRFADDAAAQLVRSAAAERVTPPASGLDIPLAGATLDAYARGNSRNLLGMHALLDGCTGTGDRRPAAAPRAPGSILPMATLDRLPAGTRAILDELAAALVGAEEPVLVPSLLRHFAGDPAVLVLLRDRLRARAGELARLSAAVAAEARALAAALPYPVERLVDEQLRAVATRFVGATSSLLVAGETIRNALGGRNDEGPAVAGPSQVDA